MRCEKREAGAQAADAWGAEPAGVARGCSLERRQIWAARTITAGDQTRRPAVCRGAGAHQVGGGQVLGHRAGAPALLVVCGQRGGRSSVRGRCMAAWRPGSGAGRAGRPARGHCEQTPDGVGLALRQRGRTCGRVGLGGPPVPLLARDLAVLHCGRRARAAGERREMPGPAGERCTVGCCPRRLTLGSASSAWRSACCVCRDARVLGLQAGANRESSGWITCGALLLRQLDMLLVGVLHSQRLSLHGVRAGACTWASRAVGVDRARLLAAAWRRRGTDHGPRGDRAGAHGLPRHRGPIRHAGTAGPLPGSLRARPGAPRSSGSPAGTPAPSARCAAA